MNPLCDHEILKLIEMKPDFITPFEPETVREGVISYGLSSMGYDIRLANSFEYSMGCGLNVDPKNPNKSTFKKVKGIKNRKFILPGNTFCLSHSFERISMPDDIIALCVGKSTYARCGLIVNVTPLEPGWNGYITMELTNSSPNPIVIHAGEGIAQLLFFRGNTPTKRYGDRSNKYQGQNAEIVFSKV